MRFMSDIESLLLLGRELDACWCEGLLYLSVYLKLKGIRKSVPFTVKEVLVSLSVYFFLQSKPKKLTTTEWRMSQTLLRNEWSLLLDLVEKGSSLEPLILCCIPNLTF